MRCEDSSWPFRPIHITNDGDKMAEPNPLCRLSGTGIIPNSHLQGIQSKICHDLRQATSILEFSPSGEPIRTDSPLLTYEMRPACGLFRNHNLSPKGEKGVLCLECDASHASLFHGLRIDGLTEANLLRRREESPGLREFYENGPECLFHPCLVNNRLFLEYDYPFLGYRELLFPVLFEDQVIAAMFVGQIILERNLGFIEERISRLLGRNPDCFERYIAQNPWKTGQGILEEMVTSHHRWIEGNPEERIVSQDRYNGIIQTASSELKELEDLLASEMHYKRLSYTQRKVSEQMNKLRGGSNEPAGAEAVLQRGGADHCSDLENLWNAVQNSIDRLCEDFSFRYVLVLGVPRPTQGENTPLKVVAKAGEWEKVFGREGVLTMELDLKGAPDIYVSSSVDSEPQYLGNLRGCLIERLGDFRLVYLPVPVHPLSSIAFLIGYREDHPRIAPENLPDGELDQALRSFDTLVVSSLSSILASHAEKNARDQLRYLGHEAGQLTAGLDWLREVYLSDPHKIRNLSIQKAKDLDKDVDSFARQIYFLFEQASRLVNELPALRIEVFFAHGEILLKWKDMYRFETERKALQIPRYLVRPDDPDRPALRGDKALLEQLVYNLVNNAVKYCHRGTKIHMDCKIREKQPDNPHILSVVDYGMPMHPGDEVYDLYWRGDVEEKGLGIGLHLARKIALAHNGSIQHSCDMLSSYNVPLIEHYLSRGFAGKEEGLTVLLEKELTRLGNSGEYNDIVARNPDGGLKYNPTNSVLAKEISKPTFQVKIEVTLPREEVQHERARS